MIRRIECSKASEALRSRRAIRDLELESIVAGIIADVAQRGDAALLDNARRFDSVGIASICVTSEELAAATVCPRTEEAIRVAYERIMRFHLRQMEAFTGGLSPRGGGHSWQMSTEEKLGQWISPLDTAGIYVPGGRASYPSSVLMLAGPARAAGVQRVVAASPAGADGCLPAAVLFAMKQAGVTEAFKIGGAAAVAAMAFGTESVPRVDKIAGPGNRFVNEAKRQLWGQVGLDGFAGPSEVCVLADASANAAFAAADLITQIEHAPDNAAYLVTTSVGVFEGILAEVARQLAVAPRADVIRQALEEQSLGFVARDLQEAIGVVNEIAPEHLSVALADPDSVLPKIRNAGCVLVGEWTPESAADYCLGPSHTLPTSGSARFSGPVTALDFLKIQSFAALTRAQLEPLIDTVEAFGEAEGFPAHGFGTSIRRIRYASAQDG